MSKYGRLGDKNDLNRIIADAIAKGATVIRDAETVEINVGNENAMRALHKGNNVWLMLYDPKFYPKTTM